jgi:AraC-like DNA-binding protein
MNDSKNEKLFILPSVNYSPRLKAYGLWIGYAYSTTQFHVNSFSQVKKRKQTFYSISHLYKGFGRYWAENSIEKNIRPGDCIIMTPALLQKYGGYADQSYIEDCIRFVGPIADMMMRAGIISPGIFSFGMVRRLKPIIELFSNPSESSQLKANLLLQNVLMEVYFENQTRHSGKPNLEGLLDMIRNSPDKWWSGDELAEIYQVSKVHLRRLFLHSTGKTPKEYIDSVKMSKASEMLVGTELSMRIISQKLGYTNPYHFSHRFKAITGVSPDNYRRTHSMMLESEK